MKPSVSNLFIAAGSILLGGLLPRSAPAADRLIDTNVVYPAGALVQNGGRVINLRTPPSGITAATGNGTTDDTPSFQDAYDFIKNQFLASPSNNYIIYVPNGTYRVTSTIIYRGTTDAAMNSIRFVGQSRAGTTIKLDSNLSAFQSKSAPASVLAYQFPTNTFNNTATANLCENLTVNTGSGNPGAAGIYFQGANTARMSNVTVSSGDGSGYCGIWLKTGSVQAYLKDITINGYGYGIASITSAENDTAWEHVSINNPTLAAIYMAGGGLSIRDLDFNQATLHVPAVQYATTGGVCVMLDSRLNGGSSANPAVILNDSLHRQLFFARNVAVPGYTVAVSNQPATAGNPPTTVPGPFLSEYNSAVQANITNLFAVPDQHTFALPVQDTPIIPWETNLANWVNVDDYGAVGDGATDDTAAIQAAFTAAGNAGKTVVYFPKLSYKLSGAITVPASVQRVDSLFCGFSGGSFSVNAASPNPVVFVGRSGYTPVTINAPRTVIAELTSGNLINQQTAPISTFVESCANIGSGNGFCTAGQSVWARSPNDENTAGIDLENYGGTLWIMGFKTENGNALPLGSQTGSFTEVLGGYVNATTANGSLPMIQNYDASLCFTGFTNGNGGQKFPTTISETQNGVAKTAASTQFPQRGGGTSADIIVPLYIGGARPSTSFGVFTNSLDIGAVGSAGSATSYASMTYPAGDTPGTYFIDAGGGDIAGAADAFHFVEKGVNGDMTLLARVDSIDDTNAYSKAGVMFRGSTDPGAPEVSVLMQGSMGATMLSRASQGANTSVYRNPAVQPPYWVKLVRTSATGFTGYTSPDGVKWTQLDTATVNMPTSMLAGLGVSPAASGVTARAIIEGVSLTTSP